MSIRLPRLLRAPIEAAYEAALGDGPAVDFTKPAGEPALVGPDSVSWRVFKNPVTVFIGGVAAVVLELAEPRVRAGVWEHSSFRADPLTRLRRTGLAAMVTVYGPRSVAEGMIRGVNRQHQRVVGTTAEGVSYSAANPELLAWVQATAVFGFLEAYSAFMWPISAERRDAYYAEGRAAAELYGAVGAPTSSAQVEALFARMEPMLEPSEALLEFLSIMRSAELLPAWGAPLQGALVRAAVSILPAWSRERLALQDWTLGSIERELVRTAAKAADHIVIDASPAVQASVRLGLPADYLYR